MTTGKQLRDEGTSAVLAADKAIHRDAATHINKAIDTLAASGNTFTAEDVRELLPDAVIEHSANVLPAVFGAAAKNQRIHAVGITKASRASRRASRNLVWKGGAA